MASFSDKIEDEISTSFHFNHLWSSPLLDQKGEPIDELEVDKERKMIEKIIDESGLEIYFRSAVATSKEFQIDSIHCNIAHFSGHGTDGKVALEYRCEPFTQDIGKMDIYSSENLSLLCQGCFKPQLVFVSACHSEVIGNAFVDIGVPHVVAIRRTDPVLDEATRTFATIFYECIIKSRKTILTAFKMALLDIQRIFPMEQNKFLLLPIDKNCNDELNSIHNVHLNVPYKQGQMIKNSPRIPIGNYRHHTIDMIGRQQQVVELYKLLHVTPNKLIVVTGEPKIGKSEVVLRALSYSFMRSEFDEFLLVHGEKYHGDSNLTLNLCRELCKLQAFHQSSSSSSSSSTSTTEQYEIDMTEIDKLNNIDELLNRLIQQCSQKLVLFFDGFYDELHSSDSSSSSSSLNDILDWLLRERDKNIRIIITFRKIPDTFNFVKTECAVRGMTSEEVALLFCKRVSRPLSRPEMYSQGVSQVLKPLQAFALHPLVVALEGHPLATIETAKLITDEPIEEGGECNELLRKESLFLKHAKDTVASIRSPRSSTSSRSGSGGGGGRENDPLSPSSSFDSPTVRLNNLHNEVGNDDTLSQYPWWHPTLNRNDSKRLIGNKNGTFLIRPSSKLGCYALDVIIYNKYLPLLIVKIQPQNSSLALSLPSSSSSSSNSNCETDIVRYLLVKPKQGCGIDHLGGKDYRSLHELVLRNRSFLREPLLSESYMH